MLHANVISVFYWWCVAEADKPTVNKVFSVGFFRPLFVLKGTGGVDGESKG